MTIQPAGVKANGGTTSSKRHVLNSVPSKTPLVVCPCFLQQWVFGALKTKVLAACEQYTCNLSIYRDKDAYVSLLSLQLDGQVVHGVSHTRAVVLSLPNAVTP